MALATKLTLAQAGFEPEFMDYDPTVLPTKLLSQKHLFCRDFRLGA